MQHSSITQISILILYQTENAARKRFFVWPIPHIPCEDIALKSDVNKAYVTLRFVVYVNTSRHQDRSDVIKKSCTLTPYMVDMICAQFRGISISGWWCLEGEPLCPQSLSVKKSAVLLGLIT